MCSELPVVGSFEFSVELSTLDPLSEELVVSVLISSVFKIVESKEVCSVTSVVELLVVVSIVSGDVPWEVSIVEFSEQSGQLDVVSVESVLPSVEPSVCKLESELIVSPSVVLVSVELSIVLVPLVESDVALKTVVSENSVVDVSVELSEDAVASGVLRSSDVLALVESFGSTVDVLSNSRVVESVS